MVRTLSTVASCALLAAVALGGCARDATSGTAILTSGPPPTGPTALDEASVRLADEICKRKASCAAAGPGGTSWRYVASGACIDRERPRVRATLGSWRCSPVSAQARLESCLPAMKTASCEPLLANDERLPLCPATETCGARPPP